MQIMALVNIFFFNISLLRKNDNKLIVGTNFKMEKYPFGP